MHPHALLQVGLELTPLTAHDLTKSQRLARIKALL